MLTFDPTKWGDTEMERWNGVVTAMRVKMHQYMGCAWTRDVQIMCGKELNRRHGEAK